ncbi:hypothetical protein [Kitasatospora sp. NPDC050463]|uniref:hypothetical protein n=1 Tax=Kitasatospora sp. NPDC050463 TaxID=3155786 RepID=UPI0033ED17B2
MAHLDVAAYFYKSGTICARCLRDRIIPAWPIRRPGGATTENILDEYAKTLGFDRDRPAFSSYKFPHRMTYSELMDSDRCYVCRRKF